MARKSLMNSTAFRADDGGNVSMIAALAIIPIISVAGLALDMQLTFTRKNDVQAIIDSAVLSGSKMMQAGASEQEIRDHIGDYVVALVATRGGSLTCLPVVVDATAGSQDISASIACSQRTTLSQIMGKQEMGFAVNSGTTYGIGKVEVAFVFDVSGSMADNSRMDNLKDAAQTAVTTLLATLTENSEDDDVRIAMVSYDNRINAGEYFEDVTGEDLTYTATNSTTTTQSVCTRYRSNGTCRNWDDQDVTTYDTVSTTVEPCVEERIGDEAFTDVAPDDDAYLEITEPYWDDSRNRWRNVPDCNDDVPVALTADAGDLEEFIDGLEPGSGTAGHLGMQWGRYLLSPDWVSLWPASSQPKEYGTPDLKKAIILMTDGAFNTVHNSGLGDSEEQALLHCEAAKEQGIVVYTVAFQAPQEGIDLLAECASDPTKAFAPEGAADLTEAYQTIASEISDLRIVY